MQQKLPTANKKRDIILTITLLIIIGVSFLLFRMFAFNTEAAVANVFYGASNDPIVSINFNTGQIVAHRIQENTDGDIVYPIIDENARTITLLGDYRIQGVRQIVVIQYNIEKRSVQIIEEQSPNNICSREGESTGWPLICLPNRVRIEFESSDEDFII